MSTDNTAFDFGSVVATDVAEDAFSATPRARRAAHLATPFPALIADAQSKRVGKTFTVPADAVQQVRKHLRASAADAGVSLKTVISDPDNAGQVIVSFIVGPRRTRKPKKS